MTRFTITPWRTQQDLLQVRQQLYRLDRADGPDMRRHAVDRVMAWKTRGNLPHAVESTALLLEAILHHDEDVGHTRSTFSVCAVYCAAFTRFVTGFCDIGRNKERSLEPASMMEIARQIGMPADFVTLRHEATHAELPALQRLVHATEDALDWLWNAYWSQLSEPETAEDVQKALPQVKVEARRILRNFRSSRRDAIRAGKLQQHSEQDALIDETMWACKDLCNGSVEKVQAYAEVFVEDKLLSPSHRELGASLEGAYLIWDGLLQRMWTKQRSVLEALVKCLLDKAVADSIYQLERDAERETYCLWLIHIVNDSAWQSFVGGPEDGFEGMFLRRRVMQRCCLHPGYWSEYIGDRLIQEGGSGFKDEWQEIFNASRLRYSEAVEADADAQKNNHSAGSELPDAMAHMPDVEDEPETWTKALVLPHASTNLL